MNKLVATFATTTVLFAGTTFYFWQKLGALESSAAAAPVPAASAIAPGAGSTPAPAHAPATPATLAAAATANSPTTPQADAAAAPSGRADVSREMMLPFAKDFLRQYDNPSLHAALLKSARTGIEAQYARLRDKLKLDANTFSQLVDLLAEEQIDQQASYFRCLVNPACDTSKPVQQRDRSSDYQALLGGDAYSQFTAFRSALPEWQSVVQLRGRLSEADNLKDGDAERLLGALSSEREKYVAESNQAGAHLRGWGNGTGMVWYSGDGGADEQLASAMQYSERLRARAATILTAEQLRTFVQLQEEMLASLANYLGSQSGAR